MERVNGAGNFSGNQSPVIIPWKLRKFCVSKWSLEKNGDHFGYNIVMLRARMFRSLIPVLMIKERNIRARNITI